MINSRMNNYDTREHTGRNHQNAWKNLRCFLVSDRSQCQSLHMCDLQDIWGKTTLQGQRTDCWSTGIRKGVFESDGRYGSCILTLAVVMGTHVYVKIHRKKNDFNCMYVDLKPFTFRKRSLTHFCKKAQYTISFIKS